MKEKVIGYAIVNNSTGENLSKIYIHQGTALGRVKRYSYLSNYKVVPVYIKI